MTPQQIELALETIALVLEDLKKTQEKQQAAITAIKGALAEHAMREVQRLGQEIEQEPVAHCKARPLRDDESFRKVEIDWVNQPVPGPLYTAPPQRTWVGLTKNERLELYRQFENCLESDDCEYEKAIEAKLKEKNT